MGGSLSHVIPHRHAHTHTERATRATYFISCKCPRKYEHYIPETEAAAFARKRQAGRQAKRAGRNWDWQDICDYDCLQELLQGAEQQQSSSSGIQR